MSPLNSHHHPTFGGSLRIGGSRDRSRARAFCHFRAFSRDSRAIPDVDLEMGIPDGGYTWISNDIYILGYKE